MGSALRWITFDDDGELTMAVLSADGPARICSQSSSLTPVGEDRGRGKRRKFVVTRVCRGSKLDSFPQTGRIRMHHRHQPP